VVLSALLLPRYLQTTRAARFSIGLGFMAAAFAVWSYAVVTKPAADVLYGWVTVGLIVMLAALLFLIHAATVHLPRSTQQIALVAGGVYVILLFVVRVIYPSHPYFSPNGLFYFGQQPPVKLLTIILLAGAIVPAALAIGRDLKAKSDLAANVFIGVCITELVGGVLLLSNTED